MNESADTQPRSRRVVRRVLSWGLGLWLLAGVAWATFTVVQMFQIGHGTRPAVAANELGDQAVVWQTLDSHVRGRVRDVQGRAIGVEFQISSGKGAATRPDVVYLETDQFIVAWESENEARPGIYARRFHRKGRAIGVELQLDEAGGHPALDADDRDVLVLAWVAPAPGSETGAYHFARRFDRKGRAIGVEFQLGQRGPATPPALAVRDAGGFLVVWQDGNGEIVGQAFDAEGTPLGETFRVSEPSSGEEVSPDVTVALDGSYVVVWERDLPGRRESQVFGRRISAEGRAIGVEFQVSRSGSRQPMSPVVTADARGHTVVAWVGRQGTLLAREVAFEGRAIGVEFQVGAAATSVTAAPGGTGDFVVIWETERDQLYGRDVMLD